MPSSLSSPVNPWSIRLRLARCGWLALGLQLALPRASRAQDAVSYKYQSWQEGDGRVRVDTHSALLEKALPADVKLKLTGVIDAIAGATPTGQPAATPGGAVPLTEVEDRRKAWEGDISRQFARVNLAVGYANSRESDYISNGWSANTATDFNQKNTTLLAGLAGTEDKVKVFFQRPLARKHSVDAMIGVVQLIDPKTSVTLNLTHSRATGYLSDPYKLIQKSTEVAPKIFLPLTYGENRPDVRDKWVFFAGVNHAFDRLNAAIDANYRYYHDNYGIDAHTLGIEWFQKIAGDRLILRPSLRYYEQTAANFYFLSLDGSAINPGPRPNPAGPFYSADYRLSKLRTVTIGLKLVWAVVPDRLSLDAGYERYAMRGLDHQTSQSAYPDANIFTAGGNFTW